MVKASLQLELAVTTESLNKTVNFSKRLKDSRGIFHVEVFTDHISTVCSKTHLQSKVYTSSSFICFWYADELVVELATAVNAGTGAVTAVVALIVTGVWV